LLNFLQLLSVLLSWPVAAVVVSVFAYRVAQKYIPEKNDVTLKKIRELEKNLEDMQTEISKLNVLFGIGQTQKNRENLIKGLTGLNVGQ
jgi:hypothetical protein